MVRPTVLRLLLAALLLTTAACAPSSPGTTTSLPSPAPTTSPPPVPTDAAGFRAQATACGATAPPPARSLRFAAPDDLGLDPTVPIPLRVVTSCGALTIELDPAGAPATVESFVFLAEQGYFDGTVVHRVVPGFIIQAGDPTGTGAGGPGYVLPDEFPTADFVYRRGVVAMANAGPGTTGSQFFVMLADAALPPTFTVVGRVVDGLDTLDRIAAVPLGHAPSSPDPTPSTPLATVYLEHVAVTR